MQRSILQILRKAELNPNAFYGYSNAWDLSTKNTQNIPISSPRNVLRKHLVIVVGCALIPVALFLGYRFDALTWAAHKLPDLRNYVQSKQTPKRKAEKKRSRPHVDRAKR